MPDLLLELFSEEIPARMQQHAAAELKSKITNGLVDAGVTYEGAVAHATPRRLCLHVAGMLAHSPTLKEDKRGPRVGAPDAAIQGFLKSANLKALDEARIEGDDKKGRFYIVTIEKKGRAAAAILADLLPATLRAFSWPKSMRWGPASTSTASLRWVRPLHAILCTLSDETGAHIIPFDVDGLQSGNITYGHRFLSPAAITVQRYDDYVSKLEAAHVIVDAQRRKDMILHEARQLAFAQGLELVDDAALLDEVAGLVEWPVPLMGTFDEAFLDLPAPVIRTTIRNNQKCFVLRPSHPPLLASPMQSDLPPQGGGKKLTNKFLITANLIATDGGKAIIAGNERVVRARLSDATFFFEQDKKTPLLARAKKLESVTFHEKLGTQEERVERIAALARVIAPLVNAAPDDAEQAARLCKADLVTEMVGEFPELQGFMGCTYAALEGVSPSIAAAIEDHYKPVGPSDSVPAHPVSIAVALADKLDMLVGFWAIDEKPTGSKDPYALRRAALGVIRIILENNVSVALHKILDSCFRGNERKDRFSTVIAGLDPAIQTTLSHDLMAFITDRLRIQLRDQGLRHGVTDAILSSPLRGQRVNDNLLLLTRRMEALDDFLKTANGTALQAGVKRALNFLSIEEKKDRKTYAGTAGSLTVPEDMALSKAIDAAQSAVATALETDDFTAALNALAELRAPVDVFFDKILVNEEPHRAVRLHLLARLRNVTLQIADFSKLTG